MTYGPLRLKIVRAAVRPLDKARAHVTYEYASSNPGNPTGAAPALRR